MAVDGTSYNEADTPPLPRGPEYHDGASTESEPSASGRQHGRSAVVGNRRAHPGTGENNGSRSHSNTHDDRLTQQYSADAEEFPELSASRRPRPSLVVPNSLKAALKGVAMDRAKAGYPTSRLRSESPDVAPEAPVSRGTNTVRSPSATQALQNVGAQTAPKDSRTEPQPSRIPHSNGGNHASLEQGEIPGIVQSQGSVFSRLGSAGGGQQVVEHKSSRNKETHPEFEGAYFEIDGERYEYEDDSTVDNHGGSWLQQQYGYEFEQYGGDDYEQEQLENELFEREQGLASQYDGEQYQYQEGQYQGGQFQDGRSQAEKQGVEQEKIPEPEPPVVRQLTPAEKKIEANLRRMAQVVSKKDMVCFETIRGTRVNILEGLELHTNVFTPTEQQKLVDLVYEQQELGRKGMLKEKTYSEPRKWMKGKGRITIQYGCCYNYAVDKAGNPPGIARREAVDPFPERLKQTIARLVMWHILPPHCVPDSCIINIYDKDDCIPPHIDHHDFVRPFCTLSLLCTAPILFGSKLDIVGPGEFKGTTRLTLPPGSVLVLAGNGADVAKHCIPAVPEKRISITFRKMDHSKHPHDFVPEPDLQNIVPLVRTPPPPPPPIVNAWGAGPPKPKVPLRKVALSAGAPTFVPGGVIAPSRTSWADEAGS